MPEMTGLELLKKIRHDYGENIGACMLTAWEDAQKWEEATDGFVINYIRKPFDDKELIETIDKYFEGKEADMVLKTFEKHIEKRPELEKRDASQKKA